MPFVLKAAGLPVSVFPELRRAANLGVLSRLAVLDAPPVNLLTTNEALSALFLNQPSCMRSRFWTVPAR
jgi:hypothetical protein